MNIYRIDPEVPLDIKRLNEIISAFQRKSGKNDKNSPTVRPNLLVPKSAGSAGATDLFADLPESMTKTHDSTTSAENNETSKAEKRKCEASAEDASESPAKKPSLDILDLQGVFAERKGERDEMQDKHVLIEDFSKHVTDLHPSVCRLGFYAVYDGHAGARAANWAAQHLHKNLASRFPKGDLSKIEAEMKRTLIEAYRKTDEDFLKVASKGKPSWKDGSTASTLLVINNTLYIANLGDSRAIICRYNEKEKKYRGITLTTDHNPSDYSERMRIQKAGAQVRDGRVMGVLEVSRSLGDGPYKRHGVTCVPDVKRCQLSNRDRWVLIACDGLWKSFSNEEALHTVNSILDEGSGVADLNKLTEQACNKLASDAVRRLSADNVTVLLLRVKQHNVT